MIVATIEARMTSSRFPGKMAKPLDGKPVLAVLIERLKRVPELDRIVLATTVNATDDVLAGIATEAGAGVFRGSEDDVLGRVRGALDFAGATTCVEITGDCPLTDPAMVSAMIREYQASRAANAYVANTTGPVPGAPLGLDLQVFDADALRMIERDYRDADAREHVSIPFYRPADAPRWNPRFVSFFPPEICAKVCLALDYAEDYALLRDIYEDLSRDDKWFGAEAAIDAAIARPQLTGACLALRQA